MVRIILGIVVGFIVWSILWVGSDQVLISVSRGWYGAHQFEFEKALFNQTPFTADITILIMHLIRSVIISLMAGFIAAFIANENKKTNLILGVFLLAFGLFIQIMAWNYLSIWYHFLFLFLLIPVTIAGGKLRKSV